MTSTLPTQPLDTSYEGEVRSTLRKLGSNIPDADIASTGEFWRHCMAAGISAETTAAVIYGTARHKHTGPAVLREAKGEDFMLPDAVEHARGYYRQYLEASGIYRDELRGYMLAMLLRKDGTIPRWDEAVAIVEDPKQRAARTSTLREASEPSTNEEEKVIKAYLNITDGAWSKEVRLADLRMELWRLDRRSVDSAIQKLRDEQRLYGYPIENYRELTKEDVEAAFIPRYGVNPWHYIRIQSSSGAAKEAPTGTEWEVIARRSGPMETLINTAGRKATAVEGNLVVFGDLYDDETASDLARKLTKAGYIVTYGPHKTPEAADEGDPSAMEVAPVISEAPRLEPVYFISSATNKAKITKAKQAGDVVVRYSYGRGYKYLYWHGRDNVSTLVIASRDGKHGQIVNVDTDFLERGKGYASTLLRIARSEMQIEHAPEDQLTPEGRRFRDANEAASTVPEGHIPWVKVERNPKLHEAAMALAEKYGPIGSPQKVYELLGEDFAKEDNEIFVVIPLNLRGELKAIPYEVARGQRSHVAVGVNDVMRAVLASGCEGFYCAHSHPSGKCTPSKADRDLTAQIKAATIPFGREVKYLDHFVVGTRSIYSIEEGKGYKIK